VSVSAPQIGERADHDRSTGTVLTLRDILREAFDRFRPELIAITLVKNPDGAQILSHFESEASEEPEPMLQEFAIGIGRQAVQAGERISGDVVDLPLSAEASILSNQAKFYMAMPIQLKDRQAVGALCILTRKRQRWSRARLNSLEFFTRACALHFEAKAKHDEVQRLAQLQQALSSEKFLADQKFNDLARNVPGAIFEYSMRPGMPDRIEFMSPGCFDIWGYTAEELEGDPSRLWEAILDEDLPDMRASVLRSAEQLSPWQHRWRIRTKSGLIKWLQSYGSPSRLSDGGTSWNTLILDVSVEQNAQLALVENTRLIHEAQKIHSIGRIVGGVAHDFNNILAVINGNAESIEIDSLSADHKEAIEEIISASIRGAELTRRLLGFARRSELNPQTLNLSSVISSMSGMLSRVLPANISMETSLTAGLWAANIDRGLLENVLLNLVINARDAMPQGGALTIETANVRVSKDYVDSREEDIPPGRYVMIAVTDNGTGVEEAILPRVFEPFFTTKGPNEGTGLGLAMVDGFVRQSGGAARIYSELGHGTSVKLYFPATTSGLETDGQPAIRASRSRSMAVRILLVEDQDTVRRIIEKTLRSAGHVVSSASHADQAWESFEDNPEGFDIIVTDIVMPGKLQGPQLVRAIRTIRRDIPVLFMSGYPHEANVHGNGVRETDISLMKPIRRGELLTAIDRLARLI
jgi:PAS domain S-box-containing protein